MERENISSKVCIDPYVIEITNGKGFCNPIYRKRYRENDCVGCPKASQSVNAPFSRQTNDFIPEAEKRDTRNYFRFRKG